MLFCCFLFRFSRSGLLRSGNYWQSFYRPSGGVEGDAAKHHAELADASEDRHGAKPASLVNQCDLGLRYLLSICKHEE
jgi:hypothetical protein